MRGATKARSTKMSKPLLYLSFLALTLSGCSCGDSDDRVYTPEVLDSANLLSQNTIARIESQDSFPPDIPILVRTVDSLPTARISVIATEMMEDEDYWDRVRPRGWFSKIGGDPSHGRGIYILLSQNPRLLQIRYGPGLLLPAYRAGLAAGPRYLSLQKAYATSGDADSSTRAVLSWLSDSIPQALDTPWYYGRPNAATNIFFSEFQEQALPEGELYSGLLKPYILLDLISLRLTGDVRSIPLINAFAYWGIRFVVINLILGYLLGLLIRKSSPARSGRVNPKFS